jgi:hypothetical protein
MKHMLLIFALAFIPSLSFATCIGVPDSCSTVSSGIEDLCYSQAGCNWDQQAQTCSGFANSCDRMFDQGSCQRQAGCYWNPYLQVASQAVCR